MATASPQPAERAKPPSLAAISDMPPPAFVAARCSALAGRGSTSTQAGVHPKVVQERLRHGTIAITLDTYSHAIPAMKEKRRQKIAALIQGPG